MLVDLLVRTMCFLTSRVLRTATECTFDRYNFVYSTEKYEREEKYEKKPYTSNNYEHNNFCVFFFFVSCFGRGESETGRKKKYYIRYCRENDVRWEYSQAHTNEKERKEEKKKKR